MALRQGTSKYVELPEDSDDCILYDDDVDPVYLPSTSAQKDNQIRNFTAPEADLSAKLPFHSKAVKEVTAFMRKEAGKMCTREFVYQHLPITKWLPKYTFGTLVADALAGLTVGLTAIPQAIAYADVAGLPAQYGLYSAFMGCFVYVVLGSCKDITIGPTAIMALMTQSFVVKFNADFAVLLCFLAGCVILLLGLLRLGFLVEFISMPVTAGFTSAAAVTIASSQLKSLLGIKGKGSEFLDAWKNLFEHITETKYWDLLLGLATIALLLLGKKLKDYDGSRRHPSEITPARRIWGRAFWLISISRNTIVVVLGMIVAYVFSVTGKQPFTLTGNVEEGLPAFEPPPFSTVIMNNQTNQTLEFSEMVSQMSTTIFSTALISILETIAIAKAFSKGKALDAMQEFIALGMCNILGSFVRSMPVAGSFTRTAVNNASGVKTPLGGAVTGIVVLLALGLLTSTFAYIPKATLAGVIICAMFFMVEYEIVPLLWRTKKLDLIPLAVTFVSCLFLGLDYGMLVGIGVNLMFILYDAARPKVLVKQLNVSSCEALLLTPEQGLVFPAAEYIREVIFNTCTKTESDIIIVIDGSNVHRTDSTVAKNLSLLVKDLELRKQRVVLWNWKPRAEKVCRALDPVLSTHFHYEENLESLLQDVSKRSEVAAEDDQQGDKLSGSQSSEPAV